MCQPLVRGPSRHLHLSQAEPLLPYVHPVCNVLQEAVAAIQGSIDLELRASGFKREHQDVLERWVWCCLLRFCRAPCWPAELWLSDLPAAAPQTHWQVFFVGAAREPHLPHQFFRCRFIISRQEESGSDEEEGGSGSSEDSSCRAGSSEADGEEGSSSNGYSSDADDSSNAVGEHSAEASLGCAGHPGPPLGGAAGNMEAGAGSSASDSVSHEASDSGAEQQAGSPAAAGQAAAEAGEAMAGLSLDQQQAQARQRQVTAKLTEQHRKAARRAAMVGLSRNATKSKNKGKRPSADAGLGSIGGW